MAPIYKPSALSANIYSLVTGMYPILSDGVKTEFSANRFGKQSSAHAPPMYTVVDHVDRRGNIGGLIRSPYLQGNKVIYTSPSGYDIGSISLQTEERLLQQIQPEFALRAESMQQASQIAITGEIIDDAAEEQAVINQSGKSMEEMLQPDSFGYGIEFGTRSGEIIGGQAFDMYDPIRRRHINVTTQFQSEMGHGIYGQGGRQMHANLRDIETAHKKGDITNSQKYDRIVAEGIRYFRTRAQDSWNPIIRHARGLLGENNPYRAGMKNVRGFSREGRRRVEMRTTVRDFVSSGYNHVANVQTGVTNFASDSARKMLKQHLGNPDVMMARGVMETYVIGPNTFGEYGPFMMYGHGHTNEFEYRVKSIDGNWFQNYFATSISRETMSQTFDAQRDARLRHAAWVTHSHGASASAAAIGGAGTVAMGGFTENAYRLYPEINLHNANEQFSDRIHAMMRDINDIDSLQNSEMGSRLINIMKTHRKKYSSLNNLGHEGKLGGHQVWAAPYIGITGQQYTSSGV